MITNFEKDGLRFDEPPSEIFAEENLEINIERCRR
jgi:hypothetical protein